MLEKALSEDTFYGVRVSAARSLAKHESDEAFEVLEKSWKNQDDARVRLAVVEQITNRYAEQTPTLIAEILSVEKNPAIQAAAIKGLGRFHGDASRRQIAKYLKSNSFRNELAVAAIAAIRQQNDSSYKVPLLSALKQHENRFSSRDFGRGLETLAHVSQSQDEKDDVLEFLVGFVNHPKTSVRTAAFSALGTLGDRKSISVLEAFSSSSDQRIARAAEQAISKLRESKPTAPKELIELRKEMASMRKESEKVLSELKELRDQLKAQQ
jgi:aminopeptidase N